MDTLDSDDEITPENEEAIKYVAHVMSDPEERAAFEERMSTDSALKEYVDKLRAVAAAFIGDIVPACNVARDLNISPDSLIPSQEMIDQGAFEAVCHSAGISILPLEVKTYVVVAQIIRDYEIQPSTKVDPRCISAVIEAGLYSNESDAELGILSLSKKIAQSNRARIKRNEKRGKDASDAS